MSADPARESGVERQHSASCVDIMELDGSACTCQPSQDAPPPLTFELWWCSWCGEPSVEWSDPCQECGEPIVRKMYAAIEPLPLWVVYATEPPMYGNQVVGVYDNEDQAHRHANRTPDEFAVARLTLNPPGPAVAR